MGDRRFDEDIEYYRAWAEAWAQLYADTAEDVRAQEPAEVLAGLDDATDVDALTALITSAAEHAVIATTIDSFTSRFADSFATIENIEVWQTAPVPDRWRKELDRWIEEEIRDAQAAWSEVEAEARTWDPSWRFDDDVVREPRHRRLLPCPQYVLERRLAQHRSWVRGEA